MVEEYGGSEHLTLLQKSVVASTAEEELMSLSSLHELHQEGQAHIFLVSDVSMSDFHCKAFKTVSFFMISSSETRQLSLYGFLWPCCLRSLSVKPWLLAVFLSAWCWDPPRLYSLPNNVYSQLAQNNLQLRFAFVSCQAALLMPCRNMKVV